MAAVMGVPGAAKARASPETVTHLHLSADGSGSRSPDELVATLAAVAKSPSTAAAQH